MLSDAQKREIKALVAQELRRKWGVVKTRPLAAAIDDIRARFIEEGWFGRPLTAVSNEVQKMVAEQELYGQPDGREDQSRDRDTVRERSGPEAER